VLKRDIHGTWPLPVVATQSITVLTALIAAGIAQPHRLEMNFFAPPMRR